MYRSKFLAALAGACLLPLQSVLAHGYASPHMFISTLLIDDPNVADEASLPTFQFLPSKDDGIASGNYNLSFEFDKRITDDFGFSVADGYSWVRTPGAKTQMSWQKPQFDAQCADGRLVDLDDVRGHTARLIMVPDEQQLEPQLPTGLDTVTILVTRHPGLKPVGLDCVASEPELWTALAILLGGSSDDLSGVQVLVDRAGLLREAWRPGDPGEWTDPRNLAARIRDLAAHPIAIGTSGHVHPH